jgi:sulfate transport system ATP-binding protein
MNISVRNLHKRFGAFVALDDVGFDVASGELVALLGPSGGGKSTLLRVIAGLEQPDAGSVAFDGRAMERVSARDRGVGFVFQHYALFRHMTVGDNVAFGLEVRRVPESQRARRVRELLALVGLAGLENKRPTELSGGQRQRVALARALAPQPRVLLLDEPFAAIDAKVRQELRQWMRRMHEETGVTSLFVTHDQEEAFAIADRIVVINHGRVEQVGTPLAIMDEPRSEFVAGFVGEVNAIDAIVRDGSATAGALRVAADGFATGDRVRLVIRAYDIKMWDDPSGIATVERMLTLGDRVKIDARVDGAGLVSAHFPRRSSLLRNVAPGRRVAVDVVHARAYRGPIV